MRNEIHVINNRDLIDSYQNKQKGRINNHFIIKQDFKNSIANWQREKKVTKLITTLQNKKRMVSTF